jgi:hypothetical protein
MDLKDVKTMLFEQIGAIKASGVAGKLHREPAGRQIAYDSGYFYGYYDAIMKILELIEKGETE